jgi:SecD/SecF fusion protein
MSALLKRHFWKIAATLVFLLWASTEIVPLKDAPDFGQFLLERAEVKQLTLPAATPATGLNAPAAAPQTIALDTLVKEARDRAKADTSGRLTVFAALREIAHERRLDISEAFPSLNLGSSLKNPDKRTKLVLAELLRQSKGRIQFGLDLAGGVAVTLQVQPKEGDVAPEMLTKAIQIIHHRIDGLGVVEPQIRAVDKDRIEVQFPGSSNLDIAELVRPARLEFRLVHETSRGSLQPPPPETVPAGYEVLTAEDEDGNNPPTYFIVKRLPEMTGDTVERAYVVSDGIGGFQVSLGFNAKGSQQFADLTTANVNRLLAIVLDGKLNSAPNINEPIRGGTASISGRFDQREAFELASVLNNPLDVPLKVLDQTTVGPSLAEDAIASGKTATLIAIAAVAAFMLFVYNAGGVIALLSLAVNVLLILGAMAMLGATMTLPGLAGIVLTIGMAVDANILIFERIREELAEGKSLVSSNQSGFTKALTTILDAHLVQLIICAVMIKFGAGPIKGFGWTLCIGVLSTLFSVLITGHLLMEMALESGVLKRLVMRTVLKDFRLDFVKLGRPAIIGSSLLVVLGFGYALMQGNAVFGRDFKGGDEVVVQFQQSPGAAKIREAARTANLADIGVAPVGTKEGAEVFKLETAEGKGKDLLAALQTTFPASGLKLVGESHVGQIIGKEILWNALKAVGISMVVILLYIAFRFEFGFGVSAMFSIFHDILMTIGIFVLAGREFNAPMVAAILCIAGYSINETVVVFDRIREELKNNPTGRLKDVINEAIRKVFARTMKTSTTTFLASAALYLFGSGVLKDIAFTFCVGIITSTFSAIFVAAQIFYWYHKGDRKHVEAHADAAPVYEWTATSKAAE